MHNEEGFCQSILLQQLNCHYSMHPIACSLFRLHCHGLPIDLAEQSKSFLKTTHKLQHGQTHISLWPVRLFSRILQGQYILYIPVFLLHLQNILAVLVAFAMFSC